MARYVAFLRGINLGRRRPAMSELKALFEQLRLAEVATFIASGNVIFSTAAKDTAALERRIEKHLEKSLGYPVDTFIRSEAEVAAIASSSPFATITGEYHAIHVGMLHEKLSRETATGLIACRTEHDLFEADGREFYWMCRIRTNESNVWSSPHMKALRLPTMTMRNMTSIRKLAAKFDFRAR